MLIALDGGDVSAPEFSLVVLPGRFGKWASQASLLSVPVS
jgi:hypothetical protein